MYHVCTRTYVWVGWRYEEFVYPVKWIGNLFRVLELAETRKKEIKIDWLIDAPFLPDTTCRSACLSTTNGAPSTTPRPGRSIPSSPCRGTRSQPTARASTATSLPANLPYTSTYKTHRYVKCQSFYFVTLSNFPLSLALRTTSKSGLRFGWDIFKIFFRKNTITVVCARSESDCTKSGEIYNE